MAALSLKEIVPASDTCILLCGAMVVCLKLCNGLDWIGRLIIPKLMGFISLTLPVC